MRTRLRLFAFLFCAALLLAFSPAYAAGKKSIAATPVAETSAVAPTAAGEHPADDAAHEEGVTHEEGHGDSHEGEGGLPQMNVARFPGQLFWLTITFIFTFVMMRFVALPKVSVTIGAREDRINSDLAGAKNKNEDVKRLTAEYETRLARARGDALSATRQVNEEAAKAAADATAQQSAQIAARLKEAEIKLATQKNEAITALDKETASVVAEVVRHVAGLTLPQAALDAAIKKAGGV